MKVKAGRTDLEPIDYNPSLNGFTLTLIADAKTAGQPATFIVELNNDIINTLLDSYILHIERCRRASKAWQR